MKEFADDNFKLDENDKKFFKRVQNTIGKGEVAHYEQFLLFPHGYKTLWEKEKLLIMSNFSFSHSVFEGLVLQKRKNQAVCLGIRLPDRV